MLFAVLRFFILVLVSAVQIRPERCMTPNYEKAQCISLYKCPVLLEALTTQKNRSIDFVRQSHCGIWNAESEPKVCCGTSPGFRVMKNKSTTPAPTKNVTKKAPLSDKRFCGYQHTDDYIYTGNDTAIDEFPWLAVFIYKYDEDLDEDMLETENTDNRPFVQFGCAGTVINARYVLTAAQCLRLRVASAVAVRLGEYNIKNEQDCVKFQDLDDCSNPVEDVEFEEKIIHPKFDRRRGINDIALIRLKKTIFFTDYIRPICLPIPGTLFAKPGDQMTTTGFGRVTTDGNYTIIKKRISTQLITNQECEEFFSNFPDRMRNVTENVLCTRDLSNNTAFSCEGDSGAPVMLSRRTQWHMEGFTVWGTNNCGAEFPRVHTKVINYLEWIEQNVRP